MKCQFFNIVIISIAFILHGCGKDTGNAGQVAQSSLTVKGGVSAPASFVGFNKAVSGIDPSSWKMKIYKVGFSLSTSCTDIVSCTISDSPSYTEMFTVSPTFGTCPLANGEYKCVIIEFSSIVKFTPAETSDNGYCVNGAEVDLDVCRTGSSSTLINGTSVSCASSNDDHIALYMSTGGSSGASCGTNCGFIPNDPTLLTSALTVSGDKNGTFYARAMGAIAEEGTSCGMSEPTWSFE